MGSFIAEDTSSHSRASGGSFSWSDRWSSASRSEGAADQETAPAATEKAGAAAAGVDCADDVTLFHCTKRENDLASSVGLVQDARMLAKRLTLLAEGRDRDNAVAPTRGFK